MADLLFLSQPALTKRIRVIEDELGIQLLIRNRNGSVFTPEGERLAAKAERVLATIQDAKDEASVSGTGTAGSLRLGFPYSFVRHVLPSILDGFTKLYPDVELRIVTLPSQELIRCTEDGTIDVCFARYNAEDSVLERQLFSEDQALVVYNRPFRLSELPSLPYVDFAMNPGTESALSRWWNEHYDSPQQTKLKVTTSDACVAMVKHGLGYGFLLGGRYIRNENGLYSLPLEYRDGTRLTRKTWVFFRQDSKRNPLINNFLNFVSSLPPDHI
ncbi:MAG: LysR family transcriptional regulator [Oscillospiraceae bacterium]|nr:LysR family transcriptional regulator [Oscillospiraceae bacterium]